MEIGNILNSKCFPKKKNIKLSNKKITTNKINNYITER